MSIVWSLWVESAGRASSLAVSVDRHTFPFTLSQPISSFMSLTCFLWICEFVALDRYQVRYLRVLLESERQRERGRESKRGRKRERERRGRERTWFCFSCVSALPFGTHMTLATLLKHWSVETGSGQETSLKLGLFSVATCLLLTVPSLPEPVCDVALFCCHLFP